MNIEFGKGKVEVLESYCPIKADVFEPYRPQKKGSLAPEHNCFLYGHIMVKLGMIDLKTLV